MTRNKQVKKDSFDVYYENLKDGESEIKEWEAFERFCAEEILPRLHSEHVFPDNSREYLTPPHDKGVDIEYENVLAQCKLETLKRADDGRNIGAKLKTYIDQFQFTDYQDIYVYLFCKEIIPAARNSFREQFKSRTDVVCSVFELKELNQISKKTRRYQSINLTIKTDKKSIKSSEKTEPHAHLSILYQSDKNGDRDNPKDKLYISLVGVTASNLIKAIEEWCTREKIKDSYKYLFHDNVRGYMDKQTDVNKSIYKTIEKEPHKFALRNNGIVILCRYFTLQPSGNEIYIEAVQIINGAQSIGSIIKFYLEQSKRGEKEEKIEEHLGQIRIPVKLIATEHEQDIEDIIKCHNTQNSVKPYMLHSNSPLQENIQKQLNKQYQCTYTYLIKLGNTPSSGKQKDILKAPTLSNIILWSNLKYSFNSIEDGEFNLEKFFLQIPIKLIGTSYNKRFSDEKNYESIFQQNSNNTESWTPNYAKEVVHFCNQYKKIKNGYSKKILSDSYFKEARYGLDDFILLLYSAYYHHMKNLETKKYASSILDIDDNICRQILGNIIKTFLSNYKKNRTGTDTIGSAVRDYIRDTSDIHNNCVKLAIQSIENQVETLLCITA